MSSIAPGVSQEIAKELAAKGISMVDAPVSGGEPKAIDGTLAIMVGGEAEQFERVREILSKMGSSVVLCGGIGSGNVTKLANQVIVALNIAAMSEALVLAKKAGVNPRDGRRGHQRGPRGQHGAQREGAQGPERRLQSGLQDRLAYQGTYRTPSIRGHALGVPLPLTSQVMEMMQALKVEGKPAAGSCRPDSIFREARRRPGKGLKVCGLQGRSS